MGYGLGVRSVRRIAIAIFYLFGYYAKQIQANKSWIQSRSAVIIINSWKIKVKRHVLLTNCHNLSNLVSKKPGPDFSELLYLIQNILSST